MEVRKIHQDELLEFRTLTHYTFSQWTDEPLKEELNAGYDVDTCWAVFENGRIASTLRNLPFEQTVRGRWLGMGGVASVGTLPEFRRRGHIGALMQAAFKDMHSQGMPVSALHPFRDTFYARYGYVPAGRWIQLTAEMAAIAHYQPFSTQADGWRFERERAADCKNKFFAFAAELAPSKFSGYVLPRHSSDFVWRQRKKDSLFVWVSHNGTLEAAAEYRVKGFAEEGTLVVQDMLWRSRAARDHLFSYFTLHAEQAYKIRFSFPLGTNFLPLLRQPPTPYEVSVPRDPMMVRVVDVVGALTGGHTAAIGSLTFALTDELCPWNTGRYQLTGDGTALSAVPTHQSPELTFTIEGLSGLLYGALSVGECEHRGWVQGVNERTRPLLASLFPTAPIYNPYFF